MENTKKELSLTDLLIADTVSYVQSFADENDYSYDEALIEIVHAHRTQRRIEATAHLSDGGNDE